MPFFSILIPSFNSRKYIKECVYSVTNQDFTDYEIIICDQGETDSSFLFDTFQTSNIKIIHKEKPSAYQARIELLRVACGEYILFLDSDDLLKKGFLSYLYSIILTTKKMDLYYYNLEYFYNSKKITDFRKAEPIFQSQTIFLDLFLQSSEYNSLATKCYRNMGFFNYDFFEVDYNKSSDKLMNISLIKLVKTVIYLDCAPYLYRYNQTSITNMAKLDYINQNSFCCLKALELCANDKQTINNILSPIFLASHIILGYMKRGQMSQKTFLSIYKYFYFEKIINIAKTKKKLFKSKSIKYIILCKLIISRHYFLLKLFSIFY